MDDEAVLALLREQADRSSVVDVAAVRDRALKIGARRRARLRLYVMATVAVMGTAAVWALTTRQARDTETASPPTAPISDIAPATTGSVEAPSSTVAIGSSATTTTEVEMVSVACPAAGSLFMSELSEMRLSLALPPTCVEPGVFSPTNDAPPCWATCSSDVAVRAVEVGPTSEISDVTGGAGRSTTLVRVDYGTAGAPDWVIEAITYTSEEGGTPLVTDWKRVDDPNTTAVGASAVSTYLAALETGDYAAAAALLGEGGQDLSERVDLEGLSPLDDLGQALRTWCALNTCHGGIVQLIRPTFGAGAEVTVQFSDGTPVILVGYSYEGTPAVTGLPPASVG